jgi:hypothetical protein
VISVALAPVGGLFATGSGDSRARIWRVSASGMGLPAGPIRASPSGKKLLGGGVKDEEMDGMKKE